MKLSWRTELPQLVVIAAMFALAAGCWSHAPEKLPIHWNFRGEVDGYGGRFAGLLLLPLMTAGVYLLTLLLPLVDPGRLNYGNFIKAYSTFRLVLVLFMGVLYSATVAAAFGRQVDITQIAFLGAGLLFIVLGNFMGKIRPNWFVGVRTPWTLSSKLSWDKTHRLTGWLMMFMGVLFILVSFFHNGWMFIGVLIVDVACIGWSIIYSYLVYRDDPNRTPPAGTSPSTD
jgi:uncharacterized membrane protein